MTGVSVYDLLYWCQRCGTLVYCSDRDSIFPTALGQWQYRRVNQNSAVVSSSPPK